MRAVLEHAEMVEVLAGRDVAERIGGADHPWRIRIDEVDALDVAIAETPLEQHGRQGGGRDRLQLLPRLFPHRLDHDRHLSLLATCRVLAKFARLSCGRMAPPPRSGDGEFRCVPSFPLPLPLSWLPSRPPRRRKNSPSARSM